MNRSARALSRAIRSRSFLSASSPCALLAVAAGLATPANAITINLTFDANVPGAVGTAGTVRHLINSAASMWEDWIEDSHTLNLTIGWTNTGGSTLAVHTLTAEGGTPHRETAGNIDFGSQWSWFIDATPFQDTEFTMASTVWRDVSAGNRTAWFNGTALDVFEVGRTGNATAGGGASGVTDMLSVALHEIGHALGMSSANDATIIETNDDDYDFSTTLTRGGALAARVASGSNIAHLQCSLACMFPSVSTGIRRLPSPTDIFSTAAGSEWTDIDLDRKFFHAASSNWDTNGNWIGNDQPDSTEDAILMDGNTAIVSNAGNVARNLFISEGANVNINNGGVLTVSDEIIIDGADSDLVLAAGGTLVANGRITIQNGDAQLFLLTGGTVDANGGIAIDHVDADISGFGTISVDGGTLRNDGSIIAIGGDLIFNTAGASTWDLDGSSGNGVLNASSGNITFNGDMTDAFNGTITVGAGNEIVFNDLATLGVGTYTGAGTLRTNGAVDIVGTVTIGVATFDWDGFVPYATTTIGAGDSLIINSQFLEGPTFANSFDGSVVNAGALSVNTTAEWIMAGDMTLNGGTVGGTAPLVVTGSIDANGGVGNEITANQTFESTAAVTMSAVGDLLSLSGNTVFNGGSYTGLGTLRLDGDVTVAANTTIGVDTLDLDGFVPLATLMVNSGVVFTINSNVIESDPDGDFDGTAIVDGTMNVNTTGAWTNNGLVDLVSGVLGGSAIVNTGDLQGSGTINAADLNNNGVISGQDGSTLNINTTSFADLDGSAETGVINALAGGVRVLGNFGGEFAFDGTINIGAGRTFRMDNTGIFNNGVMNMAAGTYLAPTFSQFGTLNVAAGNSVLQSDSVFGVGGTTNLTGATSVLRINGSARLDAGHNLNGAGDLEVLAGSTLSGNGTAATDVINRGTIRPGTSVGTLTITHSYAQAATGTYVMEISAHNVNDRINITANAALAGALDIDILGGFVPDWGDSWTIMSYGTVSGDFTNFAGAPALGANLFWWRERGPTTYRIGVRNAGDLDHDGDVDFTDLNNVLSFFGAPAPGGSFGMPGNIGDANEDGTVNFIDLNLVLSFFGTFAPPNAIPSPGAATLAAIGMLAAGWRRRRDQAA